MKNISTGTGLCVLGLCLASYPIIDRVMPRAEAGPTHVAAVVAAATAQNPPEPTIVWYGIDPNRSIFRAWSDGRVETKFGSWNFNTMDQCWRYQTDPSPYDNCPTGWILASDPAEGYTYRSDINFDSKVDGSDLAQVLNDWGNAPRQDIPPSDCPLALINP